MPKVNRPAALNKAYTELGTLGFDELERTEQQALDKAINKMTVEEINALVKAIWKGHQIGYRLAKTQARQLADADKRSKIGG